MTYCMERKSAAKILSLPTTNFARYDLIFRCKHCLNGSKFFQYWILQG